ncbi:MAG: hypothetical protein ACHQWU_13900 [Gemmatimonadales bacterium]
MADDREYDSSTFVEATGASTGDARANDQGAAGFTDPDDRLFRSHFQRANRLADVGYAQARPAYRLGFDAASSATGSFEEIEKQLANGWLNVRVGGGDWASVREFVRAGFDRARQGRVAAAPSGGAQHERPSYFDPLADGVDPTSPESPERSENGPPE